MTPGVIGNLGDVWRMSGECVSGIPMVEMSGVDGLSYSVVTGVLGLGDVLGIEPQTCRHVDRIGWGDIYFRKGTFSVGYFRPSPRTKFTRL